MDELKILSKLIEKGSEGASKTDLKIKKGEEDVLSKMIENGLIRSEKIKGKERFFITEKGESEFLSKTEEDEFQKFVKEKILEIESEIKKLNVNFENFVKLLQSRKSPNISLNTVNLEELLHRVYDELSTKDYSYLKGLVPIVSLVSTLVQKFNVPKYEVEKVIYDLYLSGKASLEYGDKKEGALKAPDGKEYYYVRLKK
ncbi:helix-turn-helix domain-containing protein [Caldisericum exile]|uniref:Uncharacterized protein n=1 Tax=Caldisericum exile (strain DSM 21853 / NBRC 104410 / AZM16c01) TaxID=511051 RepID=A0A7U6JEF0_CALEA|nr:hypothetical protein [Caldisericum exile]BAL80388.1 hypothetical protein CSE_02620 [Caldisericum exile AZM16c01]